MAARNNSNAANSNSNAAKSNSNAVKSNRNAQKQKGNLFWKIFAVSVVLLCILMAVLLRIGYKVMMDYDESQSFPFRKSNEIADALSAGDYSVILGTEESPNALYFEKDEYLESITAAIAEAGGVTVTRGFSYDRFESPIFDLKAGSEKIASVEFVRSEAKSKYGFDRYELRNIKPLVKGSYGIKVLLPDNCGLFINETHVPAGFKTGDVVEVTAAGDSIGALSGETAATALEYYFVDGLTTAPEPVIRYEDTGAAAETVYSEEYGAWTVKTYEFSVSLPSNYRLLVNGRDVTGDERFIAGRGKPIDGLKDVMKYMSGEIYVDEYRFSGIRDMSAVTVEATDFRGGSVTPAKNSLGNVFTFAPGLRPANYSDFGISEDYLFERAIGYAKFVNNDGSFWDVFSKYVKKDTPMYKELEDFWVVFTPHNSYWIEDKKVDEVAFFSDEMFKATVSFEYWIKGYNHQTDNVKGYPTTVSFWYLKTGDGYRIVDYSLGG